MAAILFVVYSLVTLAFVAAIVAGLVASVVIVIDSFKASVKHGLLSLLVPFYLLYYMFARLSHPRRKLLASLVVAGLVSSGLYVAFGLYAYRKFVLDSKQAEGRYTVGQIAKNIVRYTQPDQNSTHGAIRELPPSAPAVPASLSQVKGKHYPSTPGDWSGTWQLIRFSMSTPQCFQYQWERTSATQGVVRAVADLDGDGKIDTRYELPIGCSETSAGLDCKSAPRILGDRARR